jgi:predicted Zn-dependent peptidase
MIPLAEELGVSSQVGSLEDPKDFQGLAHFCEHMAPWLMEIDGN